MKLLEWAAWAAALVLSMAFLAVAGWPVSHWYSTGVMHVDDFTEGEPFILQYAGGPVRPFIGSYSVTLRDGSHLGVIAEDRSAPFQYLPGVQRPDPLTIEWWAPGSEEMHNPAPGQYVLKTCWTVHMRFAPGKTACMSSNIFTVHPNAAD